MTNLSPLERLMIKQTCRFFAYKQESNSNQSPKETSSMYSYEFLRKLYDHPEENVHIITKLAMIESKNDKVNAENVDNDRRNILLDFFKKVVDMKSQPAKQWTDLQHYLCFVYRYCMANEPDPEQEVLSIDFISNMRVIVCSLLKEDEIQLCLRLFSLVREYTVFAHKLHKKKTDVESSIESLFYYYEAFLSASKNISKIFPEIEKLLINTYRLGWLDINTSIFMYYFYETANVQSMIREFEEIKDNVSIKTAGIYTVLTELHKLWRSQILGIKSKLGSKFKQLNADMMYPLERILAKNFWIDRTLKERSLQSKQLFDCQLFTLVGNKNVKHPEPIIGDSGQCICEDCLIIKYHCKSLSRIISDNIDKLGMSANSKRISPISQNSFINHFNSIQSGDVQQETKRRKERGFTRTNKFVATDIRELISFSNTESVQKSFHEFIKSRNSTDNNKENKEELVNDVKSKKTAKSLSPKREEPKVEVKKATKANSNNNSNVNFPCGHSCKLEEELKTEFKKAYQDTCDHHKELKKCDCTFCEVFGTTTSHVHKTNETRNRLRIRLNQRTEKAPAKARAKPAESRPRAERQPTPEARPPPAEAKERRRAAGDGDGDIRGILSYIEGSAGTDKMAIAEKKAAKKARQRSKKEEERLKVEQEERRRAAEEKRKNEERLRSEELARLLSEKSAKNAIKKEKKRQQKNTKLQETKDKDKRSESIETIPAMVTIKRVIENQNSLPTVTITLKGSTPDQDKLLYTLVNGGENGEGAPAAEGRPGKRGKKPEKGRAGGGAPAAPVAGKKKGGAKTPPERKDIKVTLAVDPSSKPKKVGKPKEAKVEAKVEAKRAAKPDVEPKFNMEALKLPPGITITKVEGPLADRTYKTSPLDESAYNPSLPVSKSGVIVVDTERLISNVLAGPAVTITTRKGRKKRNRRAKRDAGAMVTLKNPVFQRPPEEALCQQASIFQSENGMVTIRSSRLQQTLAGAPPATVEVARAPAREARMSAVSAQEILSGLPGIEITKVSRGARPEERRAHTAEVSIIPTSNGDGRFHFDKDDLHYDNVFTPRDVLEDDMDADERELEAFKRFCQQSVPPERKEKVAHLNVKDIVLKKKNEKISA